MNSPTTPNERELFEAWIHEDRGDLTTFGSGANMHYRNSAVNNSWLGWQAARATAQREPLTDEAINAVAFGKTLGQNVPAAFVNGVRFAEQHHGIGVTK